MSANDFLAQSTPQSIGATSIPSSESFLTPSVTSSKALIQTTGLISSESFLSNLRIANIAFLYPTQIESSESIPTDINLNVFYAKTFFEMSTSISSSEFFPSLLVNSITELQPTGLGSTENFPSTAINFLTYMVVGSGITSSENLRPNNLLKHIGRITSPLPIEPSQSFTNPSIFLSRTLYPGGINSHEFITNNHLINGIQPTIRFVQQYSINSSESFATNTLSTIPISEILKVGFLKSWIVVENNLVVRISKRNILDVDTIVEHKKYLQTQSKNIVISDLKKQEIETSQQSKYKIFSFIDFENLDMARHSTPYLENYIKEKYHIESYVISENEMKPKITRYKIERY
jgi:hypothetical protein